MCYEEICGPVEKTMIDSVVEEKNKMGVMIKRKERAILLSTCWYKIVTKGLRLLCKYALLLLLYSMLHAFDGCFVCFFRCLSFVRERFCTFTILQPKPSQNCIWLYGASLMIATRFPSHTTHTTCIFNDSNTFFISHHTHHICNNIYIY